MPISEVTLEWSVIRYFNGIVWIWESSGKCSLAMWQTTHRVGDTAPASRTIPIVNLY